MDSPWRPSGAGAGKCSNAADRFRPVTSDSAEDVGQAQAVSPRVDDEPFCFVLEEYSPGRCISQTLFGDDCADTRPHREQASLDQRGYDLVRRVRVDSELLAEGPHRREAIARTKLAGDDRARDRVDDLFVDRNAGLECDRERSTAGEVF
jgi:hypothetical protein